MKHFDTHVRLAIGWKTFGINALTDFSCQSDKSVSKADKTSPRSPRSSAHHVSSYKIIHVISVSGDMQWHAEYDNIPPTPQILQHYCQIKTLTLALSPRSGGREVRSCQPRRHSHKSGAEREREGGRCFKFNSNPSISQDPPAQNLTFSIILSQSGSTLSNNPGPSCQVQWTETNAMIEFPQKTIQF